MKQPIAVYDTKAMIIVIGKLYIVRHYEGKMKPQASVGVSRTKKAMTLRRDTQKTAKKS